MNFTVLNRHCSLVVQLPITHWGVVVVVCIVDKLTYKLGLRISKSKPESLADPGGRRRRAPPQQDPFLSFLHTFPPKSVHVGGEHPPPTGNPGSATDSEWYLVDKTRNCFSIKVFPVWWLYLLS